MDFPTQQQGGNCLTVPAAVCRLPLNPILLTGVNPLTSEEEDDQKEETPVKLMLIVLNEDANV